MIVRNFLFWLLTHSERMNGYCIVYRHIWNSCEVGIQLNIGPRCMCFPPRIWKKEFNLLNLIKREVKEFFQIKFPFALHNINICRWYHHKYIVYYHAYAYEEGFVYGWKLLFWISFSVIIPSPIGATTLCTYSTCCMMWNIPFSIWNPFFSFLLYSMLHLFFSLFLYCHCEI